MSSAAPGNWTFLFPVGELFLTKAGGREFRVDRVTLVHPDKLPRVRKRLGLPAPVSEIKQTLGRWDFFEPPEPGSTAFAVVRQRGSRAEAEAQCLALVREELSILALSQLGYSRRKQMGPIVAPGEIAHFYATYLLIDSTSQASGGNMFKRTVPFTQSVLDGRWKRRQDAVFFTRLLKILRGETRVERSWRGTLRRAAVLVGESIGANDPFKSFLWNMIALEMILTTDEKGEVRELLPRRVGALLDWSPYWDAYSYGERIKATYDKRNALLHRGRRDELTEQDVAFTDHLLENVLANIVWHPKLFDSKEAFVEFCAKVEAERTLGTQPRVRPPTFRFIGSVKLDF